jgi:hypothetical protein
VELAELLVRPLYIHLALVPLPVDPQDVYVVLVRIVALLVAGDLHVDQLAVGRHAVPLRHERQQRPLVVIVGELHLREIVQEEVELSEPRLERALDEAGEVGGGFRIGHVGEEGLVQVGDRLGSHAADARRCHLETRRNCERVWTQFRRLPE